jgi:hypothetical protein
VKISTHVLAASQDDSLACSPLSGEEDVPLGDDERGILRLLPETIIETSEDALPLQVYLASGESSWGLAIFPAEGGKIEMEGDQTNIHDGGRGSLMIFPNPFGAQ